MFSWIFRAQASAYRMSSALGSVRPKSLYRRALLDEGDSRASRGFTPGGLLVQLSSYRPTRRFQSCGRRLRSFDPCGFDLRGFGFCGFGLCGFGFCGFGFCGFGSLRLRLLRLRPLRPRPLRLRPLRPRPLRPRPLRPRPLRLRPLRPRPLRPRPLRPRPLRPRPLRLRPLRLRPLRPRPLRLRPLRPRPLRLRPLRPRSSRPRHVRPPAVSASCRAASCRAASCRSAACRAACLPFGLQSRVLGARRFLTGDVLPRRLHLRSLPLLVLLGEIGLQQCNDSLRRLLVDSRPRCIARIAKRRHRGLRHRDARRCRNDGS